MEIAEILVFIGIAVLLGGLVIGIISGWDYRGTFGGLKNLMMRDGSSGFKKATKQEFAVALADSLENCRLGNGQVQSSLYLSEEGFLNKSELFGIYKNLSWCGTIQSASNSCGEREDLDDFGQIALPRVIHVECSEGRITIR